MLTYEIARLFALDAVEKNSAKNFIDWAMGALEKGAPEISIAILAGLNPATPYSEAKEWFIQAIVELGLEEPKSGEKLDLYVEAAAKEISDDKIHYREFLQFVRALQFERGVSSTKYDLTHLYLLQYAIEELEDEPEFGSYYYEGMNAGNAALTVKIECQILLGILSPEASPRYAQEQRMAQMESARKEPVSQMNVKSMALAINDSTWLPVMIIVAASILIWCLVQINEWLLPG